MSTKKAETKCIAVHLPVEIVEQINLYRLETGKSMGSGIISLIEKGLNMNDSGQSEKLSVFYSKVRIDKDKITVLGQKLQNGELDTSRLLKTYCLRDDPSVGISFWLANDREEFDRIFNPHRFYYKEVLEAAQVITPIEAMGLILKTI